MGCSSGRAFQYRRPQLYQGRRRAEVSDGPAAVERRAPWDGRGDEWTKQPIAQFRYAADRSWHVYWQRATGRWDELEDLRTEDITRALRAVGRDPDGVFWG